MEERQFELIMNAIKSVHEEVSILKEDVRVLKEEVSILKEDVRVLKADVSILKEDSAILKKDVKAIKTELPNIICEGVQRSFDNHIETYHKGKGKILNINGI